MDYYRLSICTHVDICIWPLYCTFLIEGLEYKFTEMYAYAGRPE